MKYREGDWEWETPPEFRVKLATWQEFKRWEHKLLKESGQARQASTSRKVKQPPPTE